jgi:hypothetical protein
VILEQARQQNLYRVEYAEAALASSYKDIDGIYRTPYGDLRVTIQAGALIGEATITTIITGGFNELLKLGAGNLRGVKLRLFDWRLN